MVEAASAGARAEDKVAVRSSPAEATQAEDLIGADAFIFACPENLAAMTGEMKALFDRTYYPLLGRLNGRPYATMICAGSDGSGAARQIARIAQGWRLKPIAEPLIVNTAAQTPEVILARKTLSPAQLTPCAELGAALSAGLALGIF